MKIFNFYLLIGTIFIFFSIVDAKSEEKNIGYGQGIENDDTYNCVLMTGYNCCPEGTPVLETNEDGQWGVVDKEWCYIIQKETTTNNISSSISGNNNEKKSCLSEEIGYPCCSEGITIVYTDEDGPWGIENGEWCRIVQNNIVITNTTTIIDSEIISSSDDHDKKSCFAEKLGFSCCSEEATVIYTDSDGQWSIENDKWCGIIDNPSISCDDMNIGCFNSYDVVNSYLIKIAFSKNMDSISVFDPKSRIYIEPFTRDLQFLLKEYKEKYDDPSEPYYEKFGDISLISSGEDYIAVFVHIPPYVAKRVQLLPEVKRVSKNKYTVNH